ncbi:MAG: gliding motility protein GldM [Chitinophagales bacterium]
MSIPKEPRQQMINVMYLVLIALLAMNVSAEILNAFKLLRDGINNSNASISQKVEDTMGAFEKKVKKEKRGQEFYAAAEKAQVISADFQRYIDGLDSLLLQTSGENPEVAGELTRKDDVDVPTRLFVEEGKGTELKDKIYETRDKFLALFKEKADKDALEASMTLETADIPEDSEKTNWAEYTFYHMPAEAARTLLVKFKNDAIASEAAIVDQLFSKVGAVTILYDKFQVALIPSATTLIQGEDFEAKVYLAASSSMAKPRISVNGKSLSLDKNGIATYKAKASSTGEFPVKATITTKTGTGDNKTIKGEIKYKVVAPPNHVPVVAADKMNVFYIGVPNPVSASITGIPDSKVSVSMTGGSITKASGPGKYTVNVNSPGKAKVNLNGKNKKGESVNGSADFRVKRIPDPTPEVGGKQGGAMKTGELKAQLGVAARLKDFDFDAKFKVVGFEMTLAERGQDLLTCVNGGSKFGGQCANLIKRAKVGSIYYFDNIRAKGPDGTTRKLPTISFKVI